MGLFQGTCGLYTENFQFPGYYSFLSTGSLDYIDLKKVASALEALFDKLAAVPTRAKTGEAISQINVEDNMGKTSVYLTKELQSKLRLSENRGLSKAVSQTVDRYYLIMNATKQGIKDNFSDNEWKFICHMSMNTIWQPAMNIRNGVYFQVQDSGKEEVEMFEVEKKELLKKLEKLSLTQQIALVEMIEEMNQ